MNLKKAVKNAKKLGFKWVAVDEDGLIAASNKKPAINKVKNFWSVYPYDYKEIGRYTGKKHWTKTLREVE